MNDRDAFEKHVGALPEDAPRRLVYADWLDENGDSKLASAQRWMARNHRHPVADHDGARWILSRASAYSAAFDRHWVASMLPEDVWHRLAMLCPTENSRWCRFDTRVAAELALAESLVVELIDPGDYLSRATDRTIRKWKQGDEMIGVALERPSGGKVRVVMLPPPPTGKHVVEVNLWRG